MLELNVRAVTTHTPQRHPIQSPPCLLLLQLWLFAPDVCRAPFSAFDLTWGLCFVIFGLKGGLSQLSQSTVLIRHFKDLWNISGFNSRAMLSLQSLSGCLYSHPPLRLSSERASKYLFSNTHTHTHTHTQIIHIYRGKNITSQEPLWKGKHHVNKQVLIHSVNSNPGVFSVLIK